MKYTFILLAFALSVSTVHAATFYVAKTGSNTNCTTIQDPSSPALTIAFALGCESAGDTIEIGDGTYVETTGLGALIAPGTSENNRTTLRATSSRQAIIAPSTATAATVAMLLTAKPYVALVGIVIDAANVTNTTLKVETGSTYLLLDDVELRNATTGSGLLVSSTSTHGIIRNSSIHGNGDDQFDHGIYLTGTDWLIEGNKIYNNAKYGIQLYPSTSDRNTVRRNYFHDNGASSSGGPEMVVSGSDNVIEYNLFVAGPVTTGALSVALQNPSGNIVRQNTAYCLSGSCTAGFRAGTDASSTTFQNNIAIGFTSGISNSGTGTVQTTNRTTGTAADIWTAPGSDYTLKAGSAAIDAGTDIGGNKCGALPDQGAYEVCRFSSASITGHTLDVTMENIYPPLQVFGSTGWSVACTPNPDACGTPVVASASLLTGSGSVARLTISGISNVDCTASQVWTVSFDATTGNMSDYMVLGGIYNQFAHSFTGRAVSNNCTGSGPPGPPAGAYIYYPMNGNANDSSGGNRHATTSGVSFATAKYEQGMQTNSGQNDYAELPYLNGVNPTTQSLTIAYGVYIPASDLGVSRNLGGVPLGTNQRLYVSRTSSDNVRLATQANAATSATEFSVQAGWSFVCVTLNAATDTATLSINGEIGASSGSSVQTYTSYTFSGNYRIGLPSGLAASLGGNHLYDEFRLYQSVVSCADLYAAWEPPTSTWTGTLSLVSARIYSAKTDWLGGFLPLAALNTNATASPGGIFTYAGQIDCTAADCSAVSYHLYYSCAACPSAGAERSVPAVASSDELAMVGDAELGMLVGAHGSNLSGALAHVNGGTILNSAATSGPDLAQNNSTVHRATMRFTTAATVGRVYCFKWREQSGLALNSYTPAGGLCVTVGSPSAAAGF